MAKITYNLSTFDSVKASAGSLVLMVSSSYPVTIDGIPNTITNVNIVNGAEIKNADFFGEGICRATSNGDFIFIVNSIVHTFDRTGVSKSTPSVGKKLVMGVVTNSISTVGSSINTSTSSSTTRSTEGDITYIDSEPGQSFVDILNARDSFAIQALRGILANMEKDPAELSNNEMMYYCQQAYQWAANMMTIAASSRAELNDTTATDKARSVPVGSLETNTEKLLNNLISELEKNDEPASEDGTWRKANNNDVAGKYTDAVAATLPHGDSPAYTNIADAEADGWVWESDKYAENVTFNEITMKGLEKLARQQRGVHKLSDEDTEDAQDSVVDPDETDSTIRFYNMSLHEHNVKKWLKAFAKKLAANETRNTLGLHELIEALQRTDSSEVENGTTIYSERIVNPKLNKLLEDLQETINSKKYERVTVYKLDDIHTALNTLNTTLTTGFASIVTAINALELSPVINNNITIPENNGGA